MLQALIEKIEAQQKKAGEGSAPWMVGEQLKDMAGRHEQWAEILCADLDVSAMSIAEAEKNIKAFADKNKKNNFCCVTPKKAEEILVDFYKLPMVELSSTASTAYTASTVATDNTASKIGRAKTPKLNLNLEDFF